jgi:hypothetical protein
VSPPQSNRLSRNGQAAKIPLIRPQSSSQPRPTAGPLSFPNSGPQISAAAAPEIDWTGDSNPWVRPSSPGQSQPTIVESDQERTNDAERQKKRETLRAVGVWVDVFKASPGYYSLNRWGAAEDLSVEILEQLKAVCQAFNRGLPLNQIKKIEYVMNKVLYDAFNQTKAEFRRFGKRTQEFLLFHGTKSENINR